MQPNEKYITNNHYNHCNDPVLAAIQHSTESINNAVGRTSHENLKATTEGVAKNIETTTGTGFHIMANDDRNAIAVTKEVTDARADNIRETTLTGSNIINGINNASLHQALVNKNLAEGIKENEKTIWETSGNTRHEFEKSLSCLKVETATGLGTVKTDMLQGFGTLRYEIKDTECKLQKDILESACKLQKDISDSERRTGEKIMESERRLEKTILENRIEMLHIEGRSSLQAEKNKGELALQACNNTDSIKSKIDAVKEKIAECCCETKGMFHEVENNNQNRQIQELNNKIVILTASNSGGKN